MKVNGRTMQLNIIFEPNEIAAKLTGHGCERLLALAALLLRWPSTVVGVPAFTAVAKQRRGGKTTAWH